MPSSRLTNGFVNSRRGHNLRLLTVEVRSLELDKSLERHGRIHTAPSWMDSRRSVLFACGEFV